MTLKRNKTGHSAARRLGRKLGGNPTAKLSVHARSTGRTVLIEQAKARAVALAPLIAELRAGGVVSLHGIAVAFNERTVPTASGRGKWSAVQVRRVLLRLA